MEKKFLDYYNQELTFIKEMAQEFSQQHPKIAGRLGMRGIEVADPYVERLIESFCFLSARTQLKLDAEYPQFTLRLLENIYPNYNSPIPSMGVVRIEPNSGEGDIKNGYLIPARSSLLSKIIPNENTRCEFRNSQDVTLWPIKITELKLSSTPAYLPDLDPYNIQRNKIKGALTFKLKLTDGEKFSDLTNFNSLPIYITGDERIVSFTFELLHNSHCAVLVSTKNGQPPYIINHDPLKFEGLEPESSLLPSDWNVFHGHTLIQEYIHCRHRFYFFTLNNLNAGILENDTDEVEITILLDKLNESLIPHLDVKNFLLFCTPVINLFPKRIDRVDIAQNQNKFHVVTDRHNRMNHEIYSIKNVTGLKPNSSEEIKFNPLFQTQYKDDGNYGRYFSVSRETSHLSRNSRSYKTISQYNGTEVYVSLVDQKEAPINDDIRFLFIDALVTNRDLPRLLKDENALDLTVPNASPVKKAVFIYTPTIPCPPLSMNVSAWRLIKQLSLNYQPLSDLNHKNGGQALRDMLRLFTTESNNVINHQIDALLGCTTEPIIRRLNEDGLLVYGRGISCKISVDEDGFSGISPYLFGLILDKYFSRHVSINVFTETEISSLQRGHIARWKLKPGTRGAI